MSFRESKGQGIVRAGRGVGAWLSASGLALACGVAGAQSGAAGAASPAATGAATGAVGSAAQPTVDVQRYELAGATLLDRALLDARLADFLGSSTLERLRAAAQAVQAMYREAGYGGVVAFVPEQDLRGGVVTIRVVEGRLARVDVTGQQQFDRANIRASLPSLVEGATPNVRRIDAEIQIANENPAKQVQVLLQPGARPGEVDAALTVAELPVSRFSARLDNTGGGQVGQWRAALGWQHANVLGLDHVFAAELLTAPQDTSAVASASGSYRAPLYGRALAVDVYGAWSNVDAGKVGTAAGDLQFSGKGTIVGTRLSAYLPRQGNIDQRLMAGVELRENKNSCQVNGLGSQACGSAGASVSAQPLSVTYAAQATGQWRWGASVGLHANLALGGSHGAAEDFEAARAGSKRRYALLRSSGQVSAPLTDNWLATLRVNGQWSAQALVSGEMFGAGGAQSVRGYHEREVSGDAGLTMNLEFQGANLLPEDWRSADLRPVGFIDLGTVHNQGGAPCMSGRASCHLAGVGFGLRAQWGPATLRFDVAQAQREAPTTHDGDVRAHLSLTVNF